MQILKPVAVALIALAPLVPLTGTTALAAAKPADRPSDKAVKKEPDRSAQKKEADKPAKKEPEKSAKKDDKPAKKEPEKAAKREPEKPATKPTEHPAKAAAEKPAAKPVESERARVLPGAPAPASPATASRIAVAAPAEIERNAILSDLAWTGDYQGGGATDAPAAAVKAFQKRNGSRETGVLSIDDRAKLAQAAKARQEQAGWRVIDDPVTGARLGIPENLVSLSAPGKSGSRWQSRHGEVQVETFRAAEAGTTIAAVFAQQKAEPAERKIEFNQLRGDSFIISGLQGLKKFQVRAQAANGEVRGIAVSYDQALEGTMDRVAAAISSTYAAFPPRMVNAAAPRRKVEYGTGVVVNNAGYIVTDLDLLTACDLIVVPGLGPAERVAEDRDASLALVRLNGVHGLAAVGVAPAEARAARAARAAAVAEAAAAAAAAKAVAAANERAALAAAGAKREEAVGPATGTSPAGAPAAQASATETEELTKAESGRAVTAGVSLDSPTAAAADGDVKNGEAPTGATAGPETAKGADTGAGEGETARTEQQGAEGAGQKVFTDTEAAKTSSAELAAANPAADIVKAEVQKAEVAKTEILEDRGSENRTAGFDDPCCSRRFSCGDDPCPFAHSCPGPCGRSIGGNARSRRCQRAGHERRGGRHCRPADARRGQSGLDAPRQCGRQRHRNDDRSRPGDGICRSGRGRQQWLSGRHRDATSRGGDFPARSRAVHGGCTVSKRAQRHHVQWPSGPG